MKSQVLRGALATALLATGLSWATPFLHAQAPTPTPFKLGTFSRNGRSFVALVLRDTQVVDLASANADYQKRTAGAKAVRVPADMKALIAGYSGDLKDRLYAIAADVAAASPAPAYAYAIDTLKTLPPVRPAVILNAGGNYVEHEQGIAQQQARTGAAPAAPASRAVTAPGLWERKPGDERDNPYLFLKSPTVVVGANDPIIVPPGRDKIDYECEFDVVIGKRATRVPAAKAEDYIFGYTIQIDVSDRGGRGDMKMGGSDWLVGKNHDTFGPLGPFIVPKEFVKEPMNTRHVFSINGTVMQDSNTNRMSHDIYELLAFGSANITLNPGDVISGGSPAGTNIERAEPRWMRAGDTATCMIEGLGTQTHKVVNADPRSTQ